VTHPWPLFDLRVRTPRLELRAPTDDDVLALLEVARAGIHDPEVMPFGVAWTDATGSEFDHGFFQFYWRTRASWSPADWQLPMAVVVDGQPVGLQDLRATDFAALRTVETGSWLGRAWQGRGIGTEMRAAALTLAFEGLGARRALSSAHEGNEASRRVSEKLGYRPDGIAFTAPRGVEIVQQRYRLDREAFHADQWQVEIDGLDGCLSLFGLPGP
jgi:RimJ/RimL family protein N-acetyltransferase